LKTIVIFLLGFIILSLAILIGVAIYEAIQNNNARNMMVGSAVVTGKSYTAPHTTYIYVNKVMVPQYHSASWSMTLKGHGENGNEIIASWSVTEEFYNQIDEGDELVVEQGVVFQP